MYLKMDTKLGLRKEYSSDRYIEGNIYDNLDVEVSGKEYGRIKCLEGEVMGRHWEQHWGLKFEMREVPLMCYQEGIVIENMRTPE